MGIIVGFGNIGGTSAKDLQLTFGTKISEQEELSSPYLPAEWYTQSGIQLTWPHAGTDWVHILKEVQECYARIATEIAKRELLLIVTPEPDKVRKQLKGTINIDNVRFAECDTNDTWARDHGFITLLDGKAPRLLDFTFNGWGLKFPSDLDNQINRCIINSKTLNGRYVNCLDFVLEGGSIDSDGVGTVLTTSQCLLSPNRNDHMNKIEIEEYLRSVLHLQRVLWIDHGYLNGDDTDSHIDTLARFCSPTSIAYVKCDDKDDEHYDELKAMEEQLKGFRTLDGDPYTLYPLPFPYKIQNDFERLPATYANFLIMNEAVLYPTYNQPETDKQAGEVLKTAFPNREIIPLDCLPLITQHGSLHCITMQFPEGVIR
ncbi:MAG: agmatine deiminase family protein [Bacteroidaceae bacterium]|nr:agmatine deiminase family protein [Bacteroidaceae bacterium]